MQHGHVPPQYAQPPTGAPRQNPIYANGMPGMVTTLSHMAGLPPPQYHHQPQYPSHYTGHQGLNTLSDAGKRRELDDDTGTEQQGAAKKGRGEEITSDFVTMAGVNEGAEDAQALAVGAGVGDGGPARERLFLQRDPLINRFVAVIHQNKFQMNITEGSLALISQAAENHIRSILSRCADAAEIRLESKEMMTKYGMIMNNSVRQQLTAQRTQDMHAHLEQLAATERELEEQKRIAESEIKTKKAREEAKREEAKRAQPGYFTAANAAIESALGYSLQKPNAHLVGTGGGGGGELSAEYSRGAYGQPSGGGGGLGAVAAAALHISAMQGGAGGGVPQRQKTVTVRDVLFVLEGDQRYARSQIAFRRRAKVGLQQLQRVAARSTTPPPGDMDD